VIVVDASVAVKWLLPEPGADAARRLLDSGEWLLAPTLIRVEVAAAIARKSRFGELDRRDAATAADLWFRSIDDGVIALLPDEMDLPRGFHLALELQHPVQDCLYLALAERMGAELFTADRKFVERAGPSHPMVRALG
jgi:predicted nucleic acid-binding protein